MPRAYRFSHWRCASEDTERSRRAEDEYVLVVTFEVFFRSFETFEFYSLCCIMDALDCYFSRFVSYMCNGK